MIAAIIGGFVATIPDWVDFKVIHKHRGYITHGLYSVVIPGVLTVALLFLPRYPLLGGIAWGIWLGWLSHLCLDVINSMGLPVSKKHKISTHWCLSKNRVANGLFSALGVLMIALTVMFFFMIA